MKKYLKNAVLFAFAAVLLCLAGCAGKTVTVDRQDSYYSDFEVQDDKVLLVCFLAVDNPTDKETDVAFTASFEEDAAGGLLKEAVLDAYTPDLSSKTFRLQPGRNALTVVFVGDFAGNAVKQNRLLPNVTVTEF